MVILLVSNIPNISSVISSFIKNNINLELINNLDNDMLIPPQSINSGCILSCNDKIDNVEKNYEKDCDVIIIVDECIDVKNCEIFFYLYIIVKNKRTNLKYEFKSKYYVIDYTFLEKYMFLLDVLNDLSDNYNESKCKYIYDGCKIKFSKLISIHSKTHTEDNWVEDFFNITKKKIIYSTLKENKFHDLIN